MIITESNGDLILELFYCCLKIAMDKFFGLITPDSTPPPSDWTASPSEDEIISPTSYFPRSNHGRNSCQRKSLRFDTILEVSDDYISASASQQTEVNRVRYQNTTEVFLIQAQAENKSRTSPKKDFEEFKISSIHKKMVHSSPKLVTSHFQDSGFLNCSIDTSCHCHCTVDDSRRHESSFDSLLLGDHLNDCFRNDEKSAVNRYPIAKSRDKTSGKMNTRDFDDDVELSPASCKNKPMSC